MILWLVSYMLLSKTYPLLIKRIWTTILDHVPDAPTIFPVVKQAKVDSDTALSASAQCALDYALRLSK